MSKYPFVAWFVSTVAAAFIYTWLYNNAQGSVLAVALYHVLDNTYGVFIGSGLVEARCIVNVVGAVVLIAVFGTTNLSRSERVCAGQPAAPADAAPLRFTCAAGYAERKRSEQEHNQHLELTLASALRAFASRGSTAAPLGG